MWFVVSAALAQAPTLRLDGADPIHAGCGTLGWYFGAPVACESVPVVDGRLDHRAFEVPLGPDLQSSLVALVAAVHGGQDRVRYGVDADAQPIRVAPVSLRSGDAWVPYESPLDASLPFQGGRTSWLAVAEAFHAQTGWGVVAPLGARREMEIPDAPVSMRVFLHQALDCEGCAMLVNRPDPVDPSLRVSVDRPADRDSENRQRVALRMLVPPPTSRPGGDVAVLPDLEALSRRRDAFRRQLLGDIARNGRAYATPAPLADDIAAWIRGGREEEFGALFGPDLVGWSKLQADVVLAVLPEERARLAP